MSSLTGPVLAEYQDLFTSTTTQGGPGGGLQVGAKAYTGDGREFRFCLAGGTSLIVGQLQASPAQTTAWTGVTPAIAAIGATTVTITTSLTVTANVLVGGYLTIDSTPGQGYTYKIKSHTVVAAAANLVVTLEDPIVIALTAGSTVTLVSHPYANVIVSPSTPSGMPVGVAITVITNAQYGWVQVTGPVNCLAEGAIAVGDGLAASDTTPGAIETAGAGEFDVGIAINAIDTTDYGPIWLNIG